MRDNWSERGTSWVANERIFEAVLAPFTEPILQAAEINPGIGSSISVAAPALCCNAPYRPGPPRWVSTSPM